MMTIIPGELYTHNQPQIAARELFDTKREPLFRIKPSENFLVTAITPDPKIENLEWIQVLWEEQIGWFCLLLNSNFLTHVPMIPKG